MCAGGGGYDDGARGKTVPLSRTSWEWAALRIQGPLRGARPSSCSDFSLARSHVSPILAEICGGSPDNSDFGARSRLSSGRRGLDMRIETRSGVDRCLPGLRGPLPRLISRALAILDGAVNPDNRRVLIGRIAAGRSDRCK